MFHVALVSFAERLEITMKKDNFIIIFFIENQAIQLSLEQVIQNLHNGFINRQLINVRQKLAFPIIEKENGYLINRTRLFQMQVNDEKLENAILIKHGDIMSMQVSDTPYQILFISKNRCTLNMKKFALPDNGEFSIGRSADANIILDMNGSISRYHAIIRMALGKGFIEDISGKAGVYLNGRKVIATKLNYGDNIMIMGYTMVYMPGYLMVPDAVIVNGLKGMSCFKNVSLRKKENEIHFERTPRIYKSLITEPVTIDAPPQIQERKQLPFILAAGPSLTMSLAMMTQLGIAISRVKETGSYTSVISSGMMSVSLLAGAVLWPFLSRRYYKKQDRKNEKYRKERYTNYLKQKQETIASWQEYNRWVRNVEYYPSMQEMLEYACRKSRRLWEKMPGDQDFLYVRLGIGEGESEIPVRTPEEHFTLYDDELLEQAIQLGENGKKMPGIPITLSLKERKVIGLVGDKEKINKMVWCMLTTLGILHSPDEVKIAFVGDKRQLVDFEWVLQLPHIWSPDGKLRLFATNSEEVQHLTLFLDEEIQKKMLGADEIPYYIIFIMNEKLMESNPLGERFHIPEYGNGITSVYVAEYFSRIPKETEAIILNDSEQTGIYRKHEDNNQFIRFVPDELNYLQIQQMVNSLAELKLHHAGRQIGIPDKISFLDMYRVGNVKSLNIQHRWKESKICRSMAAPIGMKADGELFYLDIHEKYHGCHGLVAGMTGSGKSEFLQEYILSLMINYSPEQVAFILIDFKGGDMARPFLKAPHLAATISNLSGNMLHRAKVSLEAEISKRQKLFNLTAQKLGIDKLDINSWHKYFDEGRIAEKLPHLVIIIDEFAQLKTQQPDFLEYLINVAQVGRSLGIHLILATQKPNGVVSPQIWSNSRFRVCLKVLDQEDSKEMIRRSDAAAIKFPGRAYVQVGYDEVFEQIQTGFSGADYVENIRYFETGENSIEMLDHTAAVLREAKRHSNGRVSGKTQLEESVWEVIQTAEEMHLHVEPLWKPLLKERIILENCIGHTCEFNPLLWDRDLYGSAVCGICDLPQIQEQKPFDIHFIRDGHLALYGMSGTGKTVFLQTLAFSLALKYSPEMLRLFVIDFGGRTLGNLKEMPHCVSVAFEEETFVRDIITQVMSHMERRKKLFAEKECNTYDSYLKVTNQKLPMILLMIDNYGAFRERMYQLEETIIQLAANAKTYGIYLVLTGNSRNAIYYKVSEHIGNKIVFQMNDRQHYRDILNTRSVLVPEDIRGRALVKYDDMIAEMQTALPFDAVNEAQMYAKIKKVYRKMRSQMSTETLDEYREKHNLINQDSVDSQVKTRKAESIALNDIPVFPNAQNNGEYLIMGKSLLNGNLQGFARKSTHHIFIGSDSQISSKEIRLRLNNMSDVAHYYFSLNDEPEHDWISIRKEEELSEFVDLCLSSKNQRSNLLFIDDFSDFYDTISDEDLVKFGKFLAADDEGSLTVITKGVFEKLEDYRDTGLFVHLVRCPDGIVIGGKIDTQKVSMLCKEISTSNPKQRMTVLEKYEAIMYHEANLSYIRMEAEGE